MAETQQKPRKTRLPIAVSRRDGSGSAGLNKERGARQHFLVNIPAFTAAVAAIRAGNFRNRTLLARTSQNRLTPDIFFRCDGIHSRHQPHMDGARSL